MSYLRTKIIWKSKLMKIGNVAVARDRFGGQNREKLTISGRFWRCKFFCIWQAQEFILGVFFCVANTGLYMLRFNFFVTSIFF